MVLHNIEPVWDSRCRVLVLGSFPSVKSREQRFFYGHPQNRFWPLMGALFSEPVPQTIGEKKALLLKHGVALWDVIASCEIEGSSDASIRGVQPNDIASLVRLFPLRAIFTNGSASSRLYRLHVMPGLGIKDTRLPSTSAANARMRLPDLVRAWDAVRSQAGE